MKYTYFKILLIGLMGIITSCSITQKIIIKGQPDLYIAFPEARIDISDLEDNTILECIKFTKKRMNQLNKTYM